MAVLVLDKRKRLLMPCTEKRARLLLTRGKAVVHRRYPFTIRLKERIGGGAQSLRLKIDPGSRRTGMALVREDTSGTQHVLCLFELAHCGAQIRKQLGKRSDRRRRRRYTLRYRAPRFSNRARPKGWLAPSLRHRVDGMGAWVERLRRGVPISALSQELVRFDMQQMENPDIQGVEYQQGTLSGYEVREYLLEKWGWQCAYCNKKDVSLQIDHIRARARNGSDRVSNLTLACGPCNQAKGALDVCEFLAGKPGRLKRIISQAKKPLRDAAAVNATRWTLHERLRATGLPVETASGGRTKFNRARLGMPKAHALDAACVGAVEALHAWCRPMVEIRCAGRGSYQRTRTTKQGFPRGYLTRQKRHYGFATGDLVRACVPKGKKAGTHTGRLAVRAAQGSFNVQTRTGVVQGISHRHCRLMQRADGYGYTQSPKPKEKRGRAGAAHRALSFPGLKAGVSRILL